MCISAVCRRARRSTSPRWRREIALRIYLTIGFVALLGLAALAATSTDRMVRRLGRRWQTLHRLVYLIALLGADPLLDAVEARDLGADDLGRDLFWLMGYRLLARRFAVRGRLAPGWVGGLGFAAAVLTALGEALYFCLAFGADPTRVLDANFSLATGLRPAVIVLALGIAVTLAGFVRGWVPRPERPSALCLNHRTTKSCATASNSPIPARASAASTCRGGRSPWKRSRRRRQHGYRGRVGSAGDRPRGRERPAASPCAPPTPTTRSGASPVPRSAPSRN